MIEQQLEKKLLLVTSPIKKKISYDKLATNYSLLIHGIYLFYFWSMSLCDPLTYEDNNDNDCGYLNATIQDSYFVY